MGMKGANLKLLEYQEEMSGKNLKPVFLLQIYF